MNTQCPFESSSRRPLKSASSKLIAATLAILAMCLLSFNSAQAQSINNNPTECGSASAPVETDQDPLYLQTQSVIGYDRGPGFSGGFYWMLNSIISPMSYITAPTPTIAMTDLQRSTTTGSVTTKSGGRCSQALVSTVTQ
jgi:hypothetical protein